MWSGAVSCRALLGHEIEAAPTLAGRATDMRGVDDHLIDYYAFEAVRIQNVGVRIGRVDPSAKPVIDALDELKAWVGRRTCPLLAGEVGAANSCEFTLEGTLGCANTGEFPCRRLVGVDALHWGGAFGEGVALGVVELDLDHVVAGL